jgi:hypothetical protein
MWEFVRRAKAHPELGSQDGFTAFSVVDGCLRTWNGLANHPNVWKELFPDSDNAREEFIYTWERIRWPQAELERAQSEARSTRLKPTRLYSTGYGEFISIVGHLQKGIDGPIVVPCVKFSDRLKCTPMPVSRYRSWAQTEGLLKLTTKRSRSKRKADEFIFAVGSFDWQTGMQITPGSLNLCLTSSDPCYPEVQENERKIESQEKKEKNENQEIQRETGTMVYFERKKSAGRAAFQIPTVAELAEALEKTVHLRRVIGSD